MAEKTGSDSEIILYQTEDGRTGIEVRFEGETAWLSQKQLAELFQKDVRTVNEHIRNIFEERELEPVEMRDVREILTFGPGLCGGGKEQTVGSAGHPDRDD